MKTKGNVTDVSSNISILVTITTVFSSTIQLVQGIKYDSNAHILLRVAICMIAVAFYTVFKNVKIKHIFLKTLVQYVLSMGLIFVLIYILGFFLELSQTAYRDIFFNYTIPFIFIATIISFKKKKER